MSKFLTPLRIEDLDGKTFQLLELLQFLSGILGGIVTAAQGFKTDFASIPQFAQNLISKMGPWDFGAVIHDWLYSHCGKIFLELPDGSQREVTLTRKQCDRVFKEAMLCKGVGVIRRNLIYGAVRSGGWVAWNGHKKRIKTENEKNNFALSA